MTTIEHQDQGGEVIVWTYPANGSRYTYRFEKNEMDLIEKKHTTNPATTDEQTKLVAPNVTPAVKEYLQNSGYDI
jgi:hypothetical protein